MDSLLAHTPKFVVVVLAAIGFLVTSVKVIRYVQLLLSLFVLSGTNVRTTPLSTILN